MAADDEFRRVAEDVRELARSLGRDFREAVDQAMRGGHGPGGAVRQGLKGLRDEARRGFQTGFPPNYYRRNWQAWGPWGCGGPRHRYSGRARWSPPAPPGAPTGQPGAPGGPPGPPWSPPGGPWRDPSARSRRPRPSMPPVRHRWDATTVAGMLAVLFGVAWLIGTLGAWHLSIEAVVAVGLMLLGASLVVTGRTDWSLSRRSWPVWLGAGLIVVLVATSSTFGIGSTLNSISFGNTSVSPADPGQIHGGFGNLTVNATGMTPGTYKIVSVAGQTSVENLPSMDHVHIDARVVGGQICINGNSAGNGVGVHVIRDINPSRPLTINLDVRQMFGQVQIGTPGCAH